MFSIMGHGTCTLSEYNQYSEGYDAYVSGIRYNGATMHALREGDRFYVMGYVQAMDDEFCRIHDC